MAYPKFMYDEKGESHLFKSEKEESSFKGKLFDSPAKCGEKKEEKKEDEAPKKRRGRPPKKQE